MMLSGLRPDAAALVGSPLPDDAFRTASAAYQTGRVRGSRRSSPTDELLTGH